MPLPEAPELGLRDGAQVLQHLDQGRRDRARVSVLTLERHPRLRSGHPTHSRPSAPPFATRRPPHASISAVLSLPSPPTTSGNDTIAPRMRSSARSRGFPAAVAEASRAYERAIADSGSPNTLTPQPSTATDNRSGGSPHISATVRLMSCCNGHRASS